MLDPQSFDDAAVLAGEYVLRLLSEEEEAQIRQRIATDPEFAKLVDDWDEGFTSMLENLPSQEPSADLRKRLLDQISTKSGSAKKPVLPWRRLAQILLAGILIGAAIAVLAPW